MLKILNDSTIEPICILNEVSSKDILVYIATMYGDLLAHKAIYYTYQTDYFHIFNKYERLISALLLLKNEDDVQTMVKSYLEFFINVIKNKKIIDSNTIIRFIFFTVFSCKYENISEDINKLYLSIDIEKNTSIQSNDYVLDYFHCLNIFLFPKDRLKNNEAKKHFEKDFEYFKKYIHFINKDKSNLESELLIENELIKTSIIKNILFNKNKKEVIERLQPIERYIDIEQNNLIILLLDSIVR